MGGSGPDLVDLDILRLDLDLFMVDLDILRVDLDLFMVDLDPYEVRERTIIGWIWARFGGSGYFKGGSGPFQGGSGPL